MQSNEINKRYQGTSTLPEKYVVSVPFLATLLLLYGISDSFFFFVALWFSVESVFSFLLCFGDFEGGFLFEGLLGFFFFWM